MKFLVLSALVAAASAQHLVGYPNGALVPEDTFEVQAAKAAHFAAGGGVHHIADYAGYPHAGLGYAGYPAAHAYAGYPVAHHAAYAGYPYGLVGHANGAVVPVDEPAVLAAKAAHVAAGGAIHHAELIQHPVGFAGYAHPGYAYAGYPYGLVAHPNGALVPAEPIEVVAARAEHLAAHAAA